MTMATAIPLSKVPRDNLKCQIEIYEESTRIRFYEGELQTTKVVSPDEIAQAFTARLDFNSGLLPENTLWWKRRAGGDMIVGIWRDPQVWKVAVHVKQFEPPMRLEIPMPGLVFVCTPARTPHVYAAKERPKVDNAQLYHAPCFNVFRDGRVCPGSHQFPAYPGDIPESFFLSFFSQTGDWRGRSKCYPDNLHQHWLDLHGLTEYPMDDLEPIKELKSVLQIT